MLQALAEHGVLDRGLKVRSMVLPDIFIDQDSPDAMYAKAGLDAKGIVAKAFEALGQNVRGETVKLVAALTFLGRDATRLPAPCPGALPSRSSLRADMRAMRS